MKDTADTGTEGKRKRLRSSRDSGYRDRGKDTADTDKEKKRKRQMENTAKKETKQSKISNPVSY